MTEFPVAGENELQLVTHQIKTHLSQEGIKVTRVGSPIKSRTIEIWINKELPPKVKTEIENMAESHGFKVDVFIDKRLQPGD